MLRGAEQQGSAPRTLRVRGAVGAELPRGWSGVAGTCPVWRKHWWRRDQKEVCTGRPPQWAPRRWRNGKTAPIIPKAARGQGAEHAAAGGRGGGGSFAFAPKRPSPFCSERSGEAAGTESWGPQAAAAAMGAASPGRREEEATQGACGTGTGASPPNPGAKRSPQERWTPALPLRTLRKPTQPGEPSSGAVPTRGNLPHGFSRAPGPIPGGKPPPFASQSSQCHQPEWKSCSFPVYSPGRQHPRVSLTESQNHRITE